MTESFDGDWLTLREPHDAQARSLGLAQGLAQRLPARPRLIDLGAGTGSLFRWLAPIIGRAQVWTFADADPNLLGRALDDTQDWAEDQGWAVTAPGRALLVHAPTGTWRIETKRIDLQASLAALPLAGHDAVVCSALLDLVSQAWIERFTALLHVPLLACLNVDGRDAFLPQDPIDRIVMAGFRRDQGREKGFGPALGPRAPAVLGAALKAHGFLVRSAAADWRIPRPAQDMLGELVLSHADVAASHLPRHAAAIDAWTQRRTDQIARGRLSVRIGHRDILAIPT